MKTPTYGPPPWLEVLALLQEQEEVNNYRLEAGSFENSLKATKDQRP